MQIAVGGIFIFIFLITVVYQMLSRYFGIAATWTEDVSMYSFIWAVFMGASAMVYEKKHFAFISFQEKLKCENAKKILNIIICIIMLIFSILMLYYGIKITKQFWNYRWINLPKLKRGPTWLCIPISGVCSSIYLLNEIIEEFKKIGKEHK